MNRNRTYPMLAAVLALSLTMTGCATEAPAPVEADPATPVETRIVTLDSIATQNTVSGQVVSDNDATITVSASVKCTQVYFQAGDEVKRGDVLCTLDLSSTQASYNAAAIAYQTSAESHRNQSAVFADQIALLEKTVEDLEALYAIGAASQTEIDQARLQLSTAIATRDATLSQLEGSMESSRSSMEQLATVLEDVDGHGNVIAPMTGTLVTINAVEGSFLSPTAPVAVIHDTAAMKVTVSVSEALVHKLSIGDEAMVSVTALGSSFPATIRSVERAANPQTKLYTVTLSPSGETGGLLSGMFADVTFYTDASHDTVVIPTQAILTGGDTQYVFVVESGLARYTPVTTGLTGDGVTEITDGLSEGETLVTVGQSYLEDGAAVRIVNGEE